MKRHICFFPSSFRKSASMNRKVSLETGKLASLQTCNRYLSFWLQKWALWNKVRLLTCPCTNKQTSSLCEWSVAYVASRGGGGGEGGVWTLTHQLPFTAAIKWVVPFSQWKLKSQFSCWCWPSKVVEVALVTIIQRLINEKQRKLWVVRVFHPIFFINLCLPLKRIKSWWQIKLLPAKIIQTFFKVNHRGTHGEEELLKEAWRQK